MSLTLQRLTLASLVAAVAACTSPTPRSPSDEATPSLRVIAVDGDTFRVDGREIRLHGIDAPELNQTCARADGGSWRCGQKAKARLAKLIERQDVACRHVDVDRYQRTVAKCSVGGRDLSSAMAQEGLAWAYSRYSRDYAADEARARAAGRGIWQAATQPAWESRVDRAARPTVQYQASCVIKGNISQAGERIYHTPGSREYGNTRISIS